MPALLSKERAAADDVQLGFQGIKQAANDPRMMQDLMKSMNDPEIMAEAQKMMQDPAFQKQMKAMMGDKTVAEAATKAQEALGELSKDPAKLAQMQEKMARVMAGEDMRPDLSEGMRRQARGAAATKLGVGDAGGGNKIDRSLSGAQNAVLGMQSLTESLNDPKAMSEAMDLMKDPAMQAEVKRMMSDPSFRAQFEEMQKTPEFKKAMERGAAAMGDLMGR